jgi:hypothetical protein
MTIASPSASSRSVSRRSSTGPCKDRHFFEAVVRDNLDLGRPNRVEGGQSPRVREVVVPKQTSRPVHDVATPPLPAESRALALLGRESSHLALHVVLDLVERLTRVADPEVVHPASEDWVHLRNRRLHGQVAARAQGVPHLPQNRRDLLGSRCHARVPPSRFRARHPPKLESEKREDGRARR